MYPGTIFNWHDQSGITTSVIESIDNSPLYLHLSSFDRGPEGLRVVKGKEFYQLYGSKMNFAKHGQPAIQAANIIDGGGSLLLKRLVAKDATLANLVAIAKLRSTINVVKADEVNGKTLNELMTGEVAEAVEYAEQLEIVSSVGTEDGTTELVVSPAITSGNVYYWSVAESDMLLKLDQKLNLSKYNEWDGVSELAIADGTKVIIIEATPAGLVKKCGVITVVSKIANPVTTSTSPTNDLNTLILSSVEGSVEGNSVINVSPAKIDESNAYFYQVVDGEPVFPTPDVAIAENDMIGWVAWDGVSELTLEDGTKIVVAEFVVNSDDSIVEYIPIKGACIEVVSKLPEDTRTSESIDMVVPTEDLYAVLSQKTDVEWSISYVSNCKTIADVKAAATKLFVTEPSTVETQEDGSLNIIKTSSYPLIIAADNGRGISSKSIKFTPDYNQSKDMENMFYTMSVYEGTTGLENCSVTINPNTVFSDTLYGLNKDTSVQVIFDTIPGVYEEYLAKLAEYTGYSEATLMKSDVLYMTNNKGTTLSPYITLDGDSIDLQAAFGVELKGGSNGSFGNAPFGTEAWEEAAIEVLDGSFDDIIWDVDTYKIAAVFDANYPDAVKDKIAEFVTFREDCVFFRDYGINVFSYASIVAAYNSFKEEYKNKFILDYYTTYEIRDPETKVRERVTMMYDMSRAMVSHFANGCYRPMAGIANNMILTSAIEGTINFTPRKTPTVNQKALLDDMRVNYAIFENGRCVVQSLYTSQEAYTQLSYGNNVLAIQEVIRSVRTACPKQRFTFTSGSDFTSYADAVNAVLKGFRGNFAELRFEYLQDTLKAAQKIFYASIFFKFNNWAQTEVFDIYALND